MTKQQGAKEAVEEVLKGEGVTVHSVGIHEQDLRTTIVVGSD